MFQKLKFAALLVIMTTSTNIYFPLRKFISSRTPFCQAFTIPSTSSSKATTSLKATTLTSKRRTFHAMHKFERNPNLYTQHLRRCQNDITSFRLCSSSSSSSTEQESTPSSINNQESNSVNEEQQQQQQQQEPQIIHKVEGLFAVHKPLDWTSNDVVSYIRGILERDARNRGITLAKRRSKKSKKKIKVGHGGTLDPLAEGVLVLGVGSGTKILRDYLSGAKSYKATGKLGFETNTLDLEGNVTKTALYDHVTNEKIEDVLPKFTGNIMQVPPIFSAIRKDGKRLYERAREGMTENDVLIDAREVEVHQITYIEDTEEGLPSFGLDVQCGGGTYIRSLIRDIGYELDTVATMTSLVRTQQGPFTLDDVLLKDDWNADTIYAAVERSNLALAQEVDDEEESNNDEEAFCAS